MTHTADPTRTQIRPRTQHQNRLDIYTPIHKALRAFMNDTLLRVGSLDAQDDADLRSTLGQLTALLDMLRGHLQHENGFVHPLIEARLAGGSLRVAQEHEEHRASMEALAREASSIVAAAPAQRQDLALRLYRHLTLFIAENLQHMQIEETLHNQALWATCSDEEIGAMHDALVASIPPEVMAVTLRWMATALAHPELAAMLGAMQAGMPPQAFDEALAAVRERLDTRRWDKLARALKLPQQPGLVNVH
jgi:Hemerythrin HHE cation binding domain